MSVGNIMSQSFTKPSAPPSAIIGPPSVPDNALMAFDGPSGKLAKATVAVATPVGIAVPIAGAAAVLVDPNDPDFAWRDLVGTLHTRPSGANIPPLDAYVGSIRQYNFSPGLREGFVEHHVPHDYVLGTNLYIHAHWSQAVLDTGGPAGVPGNCKWSFDIVYAKGHQQAAFAPTVKTVSVIQQASNFAFRHNIAEVQCSVLGGSATLLDSSQIEPDGMLLIRMYRDSGDVQDTCNANVFGHFCDIHYQSNNLGTKNKSPDFYL